MLVKRLCKIVTLELSWRLKEMSKRRCVGLVSILLERACKIGHIDISSGSGV
jgi:hypothetical protein